MRYRQLGSTGLRVSQWAFGAGPVPQLLTGEDQQRQVAVVRHALRRGVNWFDTAATYGQGRSETSLGRALRRLADDNEDFEYHLATKVRVAVEDFSDLAGCVERSLHASLERLQVDRVCLLQIHNSITARRGDQPTSITVRDVLSPRGILSSLRKCVDEKLVDHLGITGIGCPESLTQLIRSGEFATMQVPFNLLNASAGRRAVPSWGKRECDYGDTITACAEHGMGVFAIRVFAGGAVFAQPPSPHTLKTAFFPLDLYRRDCQRCDQLRGLLSCSLPDAALRFVRDEPLVSSGIIGFAETQHIDQAVDALEQPPLRHADRQIIEAPWR